MVALHRHEDRVLSTREGISISCLLIYLQWCIWRAGGEDAVKAYIMQTLPPVPFQLQASRLKGIAEII